MSFWQWLTGTGGGPAGNATADGTINWAEGQSPSSVNDSARAMMARLAEFRDDSSGLLQTSGTSSAYTLTTNQGLSATPNNGQLIAFTPHTTNAASATLAADGGTAYPIQTSPGSAVPTGTLVQGTPYTASFSTANSAWMLRNYFANPATSSLLVPVGGYLFYDGSSPPSSNFALPAGQAISRTTYASYFSLVGTRYGSGDGVSTFNVLDMRGRGFFGLDNMGGSAANRITSGGSGIAGTSIGATGGQETHVLSVGELANHAHGVSDPSHSHSTQGNMFAGTGGGAFSSGPNSTVVGAVGITLTSNTTNISIGASGSGNAHQNMPPAAIIPIILRII